MNDQEKRCIQKNFRRLLEVTDPKVLTKVAEKKVFPPSDLHQLTNENINVNVRMRKLLLLIQSQNRDAFNKLIKSYEELNNREAAGILKGESFSTKATVKIDDEHIFKHARPYKYPINQIGDAERLRTAGLLHEKEKVSVSLSTERLLINVQTSKRFYDLPHDAHDPYPMRSKKRGAVLIINNIDFNNRHFDGKQLCHRSGAEIDQENLQELFTQLNFVIRSYTNLDYMSITEKVISFVSDDKLLSSVDCCFVIVMSHGNQRDDGGFIISTDAQAVRMDWLITKFNNANCRALLGKPKVFILQHCRGQMQDVGVSSSRNNINFDNHKQSVEADGFHQDYVNTRSYSDILIVQSTTPGFVSFRDPSTGTWLIHNICSVFMNHACDTNVYDLFVRVDELVRLMRTDTNCSQTTCISNWGFGRKMFLNPGIYENDRKLCVYDKYVNDQ